MLRLNCGAARLMILSRLLNPVSAAFGMHAKGFWPLQLENAAQMSPSLLHVCCAQLTGN